MDGFTLAWAAFWTLVGLKLSGTINWSWWWVWAPIWIDAAASIVLITILSILGVSFWPFFKRQAKRFSDQAKRFADSEWFL
jgi:hypothetical protein